MGDEEDVGGKVVGLFGNSIERFEYDMVLPSSVTNSLLLLK